MVVQWCTRELVTATVCSIPHECYDRLAYDSMQLSRETSSCIICSHVQC